jgi:hypothetical protein
MIDDVVMIGVRTTIHARIFGGFARLVRASIGELEDVVVVGIGWRGTATGRRVVG